MPRSLNIALSLLATALVAVGCGGGLDADQAIAPDSLLTVASAYVGDTLLVRAPIRGISTGGGSARIGDRRSPVVLRVQAPDGGLFDHGDAGRTLVVKGRVCELRTSRQALVLERQRLETLPGPLDRDQQEQLNNVAAKIAYMELEKRDYSVEYFLQAVAVDFTD